MINNLVLIGITGVGKTTIGKQIAKSLDKKFIDLDKNIELRCGVDIPTIFEIEGEEGFRKREHFELEHVLTKSDSFVLSVGGGCIVPKSNRDLILNNHIFIVQLYATIPVLVERLAKAVSMRPLLNGVEDPTDKITQLYQTRKQFYDEIANLTIDTSNLHPNQTAEIVINHFKNL
jgi:shikimate kinase